MQLNSKSRIFLKLDLLFLFFFLFAMGTRYGFHVQIHRVLLEPDLSRIIKIFDSFFFLLIFGLVTIFLAGRTILSHKVILPLERILFKTKSILNQDSHNERIDLESSLELLIDAIRKDLETKIESLTTEREEQATLMSAISDAILAVDTEGAPLFYNSRFLLLFGNQQPRIQGKIGEIFQDRQILAAFRTALQDGKPFSVNALPFDPPSGRRYFSVSVAPLRKRQGKDRVYGAVGIFHDVTDLKQAEQIRIDFVANVSHELRTPLTAIKGYTDTLMLDWEEGKPIAREFIEIIFRNANRLMNLIQDLLDLSSLESSQASADSPDILQKYRLSVEEFSGRVTQQMRDVFQKKRQELWVDFLTPTVLADPRKLEQVLVNLLDNANKYTPPGGKIHVVWDKGKDGDTLLKVIDRGPGIPTEHHARLFERFYRVDKARSREQGGTGLGLAIVKHIMQRHDGSVWVESCPGNGATFVCRFPDPLVKTPQN